MTSRPSQSDALKVVTCTGHANCVGELCSRKMDDELVCNFKKCRRRLKTFAWVIKAHTKQ